MDLIQAVKAEDLSTVRKILGKSSTTHTKSKCTETLRVIQITTEQYIEVLCILYEVLCITIDDLLITYPRVIINYCGELTEFHRRSQVTISILISIIRTVPVGDSRSL